MGVGPSAPGSHAGSRELLYVYRVREYTNSKGGAQVGSLNFFSNGISASATTGWVVAGDQCGSFSDLNLTQD